MSDKSAMLLAAALHAERIAAYGAPCDGGDDETADHAHDAAGILDSPFGRYVAELERVAEAARLVCSLCLFVGDSEDPEPVTILNGQLVCEPHNSYFQGGEHVQAIIAWKREHPG